MKKLKLKDYIYPTRVIASLKGAILDISHFNRYKKILEELEEDGKLDSIGFKKEGDKLFVGVDLNPELLMYTEESQESVELKFVSDSMKKYTNFLQNEGILDSIQADYERIYNEDFYGYIVQISYSKKYNPSKFKYDIGFVTIGSIIILSSLSMLIKTLV